MMSSAVLTIAVLSMGCAAAVAADAPAPVSPAPALPSFALNPPPPDADPKSPWTGLYVGTEMFAVGGKGLKGGIGGGGFAGYQREFANDWVLGVEGGLGYAPNLWRGSNISGFEVASTSVKAGYDMGRFMPFVTADVLLARPQTRGSGYAGVTDTANTLFNDPGNLKAFGAVGAGVDYAITSNLSVELAVKAVHAPGLGWP